MRIKRGRLQLVERQSSTPEPEPGEPAEAEAPTVAPLPAHDHRPRMWNLWELERLSGDLGGDGRGEERALLLLHLREFADPSGELPLEFDPLVRDAFGPGLGQLVR